MYAGCFATINNGIYHAVNALTKFFITCDIDSILYLITSSHIAGGYPDLFRFRDRIANE